jgi:hypothetical protein
MRVARSSERRTAPLHTAAESWWPDLARERDLVIAGKVVLRCSTSELRREPSRIVRDLLELGVPSSGAG